MSGVQCRCGRFLARAFALMRGERLTDVRGDCSRCGTDVQAMPPDVIGDRWWWDATSWTWPEEVACGE